MNYHTSSDIHLPKELVDKIENLDFFSNNSLLEIQKNLELCMNGLTTHDSLEDNLLVADYARNRGILSLSVSIEGENKIVKIPGIIDGSGNAIIVLSKVSISYVPELQVLLDLHDPDLFAGSEYRVIHMGNNLSDTDKNTIVSLIYSNFSASVTSPLKQDIVPIIVAGTGYNLPLHESADSNRSISRRVQGKYLAGKDKDTNWFREVGEKHETHYQNFFEYTWGNIPDAVFLTASGLSANAATIRYISSQIPSNAVSVLPGYFFLNEVNFPEDTTHTITDNTQALFCAIEAGYAGLGDNQLYIDSVEKGVDQFMKNAQSNPEKPYFFSVDVTSDIIGNEIFHQHIERMKYQANITIIITSSLTKYNRSESNYHYGIAAVFGNSEIQESMKKYISTSYGDLSRLGTLQFPRLRPSEISDIKEVCEQNRQICIEALLGFSGVKDLVTVENHSAYSYIIPITEDIGLRNKIVSSVLGDTKLQKWQGSSFYHDSPRICDVPDVACSRFHPGEDTCFKNSIRISWPTKISPNEMQELGTSLANNLLNT